MNKISNKNQSGFTLIEILVVIGIIAVLAAIVLIAINPARQFAQARNAQRSSDINGILNSVGQYVSDNKGLMTCFTSAGLDATPRTIRKPVGVNGIDARACIVSNYMSEIPVDPSSGTAYDSGTTNYDTGYMISQDATTKRITVTAPGTEVPPASGVLSLTR